MNDSNWRAALRLLASGVVAALAVGGCDFSAPVDIELPDYDPLVVVGGLVAAGVPAEIRLGASAPTQPPAGVPVDSSGPRFLGPGAVVEIYDSAGQRLDSLRYAEPFASPYPRYLGSVPLTADSAYELRVQVSGLPSARAATRMPSQVAFTASLQPAAPDADERELTIRWTDPPGPTTYHVLVTAPRAGGELPSRVGFESTDSGLRGSYEELGRPPEVDPDDGGGAALYFGQTLLLDDEFDGQERELTLSVRMRDVSSSSLRVTLSVLSDDFVSYMRALRIQQATSEDPFVLPADGYTNVEGGLGAFAGFTPSTVQVSL